MTERSTPLPLTAPCGRAQKQDDLIHYIIISLFLSPNTKMANPFFFLFFFYENAVTVVAYRTKTTFVL